jgi:predicted DNA-binding protein (MmcQ/YjbR family)
VANRKSNSTEDALRRLREICLALPEAAEKETWEIATFRVRDKIFAMQMGYDGRFGMTCKAPPGAQEVLVGSEPERFFLPPYVAHKGWIGVRLDDDDVDWDEVTGLVTESYLMTAPKRLAAQIETNS